MSYEDVSYHHFASRLKAFGLYEMLSQRCASKYGVTLEQIHGEARFAHVARARHEAMYLIRAKFKWSYPVIGRLFNRDHTTVISAVRRIQELIEAKEADAEFLALIAEVSQ